MTLLVNGLVFLGLAAIWTNKNWLNAIFRVGFVALGVWSVVQYARMP